MTMDAFMQEVFLIEIVTQCRFALHAHEELAKVSEHDIPGTFYQIQTFLAATVNIANVLFPRPRRRKSDPDFVMRCERRGQQLVDLLAIQGLDVFDNRDVRNGFLHADERVQDWVEGSVDRRLRDYALIQDTPPSSTEGHLHWYAKKTNEAGFGEHRVALSEFVEVLTRLQARSRQLLPPTNTMHRS
jgi:hypothetical protein